MKLTLDIDISIIELGVICLFVVVLFLLLRYIPYKKLLLLSTTLLGWRRGNSS
jgi:hypothetical protein